MSNPVLDQILGNEDSYKEVYERIQWTCIEYDVSFYGAFAGQVAICQEQDAAENVPDETRWHNKVFERESLLWEQDA